MRNRRIFPLLLLSLMSAALLILLTRAETFAVIRETDGPRASPPASSRLIVELTTPPLAEAYKSMASAAAADGALDANASAAQAYIAQVQAEQAAFLSSLQAAMPGVAVSSFINEAGAAEQAAYQVVMNGIAVDVGSRDRDQARAQIARLPGVKAVYLDQAYQTQLYTSTTLINAPVVWEQVGGVGNAGAGVRFASVDGGVHKDAPMFSGAGYAYPNGYGPNGLGLTANNNGKIIASRVYFRSWDPPTPGDENPWPGVNGTPHGVHTASTAAGNCVENVTYAGFEVGRICGVAPRAYVMSYRIFYPSVTGNESAYTAEILAALDDAVRDGAQVINNSWGGGPLSEGGEFDPVDTALTNATDAGVFVAMSNGNAGPGLGTGDHPSDNYINAAASTTSGTLATGSISVSAPTPVPDTNKNFETGVAEFGAPLPTNESVEHAFKTAAAVAPTNTLGCNPFPANTFAGVAAVISRGTCDFSLKVYNAQQAGAVFAVIYNHAAGGDDILTMGAGSVGNQVTIPSVFIGRSNGLKLVDWYAANGDTSKLVFSPFGFQVGNTPDEIIAFSSRGPAVGNSLKPDLTAPGVNILAQGYTPGATGEARHLGYGQVSGTSMAAPHVAGAAILIRQLHPTWTPAEIKSVLMSSAKYLDVYTVAGDPAQPLDMGAGRLDVAAAAASGVILDPPSLSFGLVAAGSQKSITVNVRSVAGAAETYALSTLYTGNGFTQTTTLPGFTVSPATLTLNPGETKAFSVTFDSAAGSGYGDNQGYIVLDGAQYDAHLPAWGRVTYAQLLADVLIIDNDFSSELGMPDYLAYYTKALDQLGLTYTIVDTADGATQPTTIPDATTLLAYDAVIFFTGDNFYPNGAFAVSTGLTQLDQDRLVEYLNSGGTLIAMGQDLASALNAAEPDSTSNTLYVYRLGANWIQDSLTNEETPTALVLPPGSAPEVFADVLVDLTREQLYLASGELSGDEEAPPVVTDTSGEFNMAYFSGVNRLEFSVTVVPTPTVPITVTAAHIHVGAPGVAGLVVRSITQGITLPKFVTETLSFSGVITDLTPAEVSAMLAGGYYVNVHTTVNPSGAVRGQIAMEAQPNQAYIDEVDNEFHNGSQDPNPVPGGTDVLSSVAILSYQGPFNQQDGTVGLVNRDQPSLERPGITYRGRSVYTSFGLEGMSEGVNASLGITPTTRSELLGLFLAWSSTEPGVPVITTNEVAASATAVFTASLEAATVAANGAPQAVAYRWDFGDGSPYQSSSTAVISHTYLCADDNTHTVRVEIKDQYGNVAIGSLEFDASQACFTEPPTTKNLRLPWVANDIE